MPSEIIKPPFPAFPGLAETRAYALGGNYNYTKQLEFHEYELSQAEQRGFPDGQIAYHVGKVTVLKALME